METFRNPFSSKAGQDFAVQAGVADWKVSVTHLCYQKPTLIIFRIGADHDRLCSFGFSKLFGFPFLACWCETGEEMVARSLDILEYSQPNCFPNGCFLCSKQGLCDFSLAYLFFCF